MSSTSFWKNTQVAKKIGVTDATVAHWLRLAELGKTKLELFKTANRTYLKATEKNLHELLRLKQQGLRYRAKSTTVKVELDQKIYQIFSPDELMSLYINLTCYKTIPLKYSYYDIGAERYVASYLEAIQDNSSYAHAEKKLIDNIAPYIIAKMQKIELLNLVEIGTANATFQIKNILENLIQTGNFGKYISVSTSEDMLNLRAKNLSDWFGVDPVDINADLEEQVIQNELFKEKPNLSTVNLYLVLEAYLGNAKNTISLLSNLRETMTPNDYLLTSVNFAKDDSILNQKSNRISSAHDSRHTWLFKLLGLDKHIDISFYEYNDKTKTRVSYFTMNKNLELEIQINDELKTIFLERDSRITFFFSKKYDLHTYLDIFSKVGFHIEQMTLSEDEGEAVFLLSQKKNELTSYDLFDNLS
jgi:uncharacterized SAM-dependent methyltransferase